MAMLPIMEIMKDVKDVLSKHNSLIIEAAPGAGKSTIIPLELLGESWLGDQKILLLEPRKIAARSVAHRMAELLKEDIGETVGYRVRFDVKTSSKTRIEVLTEGVLTRLIQNDNSLEGVGAVLFDEFHERSLHADLALALIREVQQVLRPDLKVIIMSATLEHEKLSKLLDQAPVIVSKGRQFPVQIRYESFAKDETYIISKAYKTIVKALKEQEGDILVFLPGSGEINNVSQLLLEHNLGVDVLPLYGSLSVEDQKKALAKSVLGRRKVVLSTSIAETSLTIEGITTVIDSGLSRRNQFDVRSGLSKMVTIPITQDAAEQRAGRAGRLAPGVCYRLWEAHTHHHLESHRTPEILEADLAPLTLELAQWGVENIQKMNWLTSPPAGAIGQAQELLHSIGALAANKISDKGRQMVKLPTHPRLAHLFIIAKDKNLLPLATDIAALLEERDPLYGLTKSSDINLRIELLRKYRKNEYVGKDKALLNKIERLAQEWRRQFNVQAESGIVDLYASGMLLACAYPERIAKRKSTKGVIYQLANNRQVGLSDHDDLATSEWLVIPNLEIRGNEGKVFSAAPVDISDILFLSQKFSTVHWDRQKEVLVAQEELRIGSILIQSVPLVNVDVSVKVSTLCDAIKRDMHLLEFEDKATNLLNRMLSLAIWKPDKQWPNWQKDHLYSTLEIWLAPYLSQVKNGVELKSLDLENILWSSLSWAQQHEMDQIVPKEIIVPSGSSVSLEYSSEGHAPMLAVRLQELFGWTESPAICNGSIKIVLHLLSPGYKPVQITGDLRSFWSNTYKEVKKELQRRYPRHSWPEDPFTATAIRGPVKRGFK